MANKPSYLTGGAGSGGHLNMKRGTEDLDFFIGDEALAAANGPGMETIQFDNDTVLIRFRLRDPLPNQTWTD